MRFFVFLTYFLAVTVLTHAREPKVKTVTAEYDYVLNPKETPEEGKLRALENAKLNAIAAEFGTSLAQSSHLVVENMNERNRTSFNSYSISDVNGEWLETISEETNLITDNNLLIYKVKIKGRIRELLNNKIDLDIAILANGTDKEKNRVRNDSFLTGDYLYVYFMSPVDGYLAVYLADCDDEQTTQCLIPYRGTDIGAMKIEANHPYILFSRDLAEASIKHKVGRIKFNTHNPLDFNQLYIIFSPNEFVKVVDRDSSMPGSVAYDANGNVFNLMPRQTDFKNFQKWLGKARQKDIDMQVIHHILRIEK